MAEVIAGLISILTKLAPTLAKSVERLTNTSDVANIEDELDKLTVTNLKDRIVVAKGILDRNEVGNWVTSQELAKAIALAEITQDAIDYISKHKLKGNKCRIVGRCDAMIKELKKINTATPTSGNAVERVDGIPLQGNLRRFLLYLSYFPESYIFNLKRISRLAVANEFNLENRSEVRPHWIEVESCWDADEDRNRNSNSNRIAYHFSFSDNEGQKSSRWPESYAIIRRHLVHDLANNSGSESEFFLSSLLFLSSNNCSLDLERHEFPFIRVLSLRNVKLSNLTVLNKLTFLRYLDLKNTNVENCDWLESLEKLEVLDLRYTYVKRIPPKCLKKLTKLKHLLLGYNFKIKNNGKVKQPIRSLAGVELNVQQLKAKHLETLRAVRWPMELENAKINGVVDLSVTHVSDLNRFWTAVENFQNLTILAVAVTKGSEITLQGCPRNLHEKLERLQIEGQLSSSSTSSQPELRRNKHQIKGQSTRPSTSSQAPRHPLAKLNKFKKLIDLTLVSQELISGIPSLPELICLRLYDIRNRKNVNTFEFNEEGFGRLKKLVIGDMKEVKTVKIGKAIIDALTTLKLSNLPRCSEVHVVCTDKNQSPLLKLDSDTDEKDFYKVSSRKIIFLKNVLEISGNFPYRCSPDLEIYDYHMGKQCYVKLKKENRQIVR